MKNIVLSICLGILFISNTHSQELEEFNASRLKHNQNSMLVLGGWAAANILVSPVLMNNSTGSEHYFHEMNLYWNLVNLGIAIPGYLNAKKGDISIGLRQTIEEQYKGEKIYLFNSALDITYVVTGLYLTEQSDNVDNQKLKDRFTGYGNSLVLQGAFLFVFDITHVLLQRKQHKELDSILDNLSLTTKNGIGLSYRF